MACKKSNEYQVGKEKYKISSERYTVRRMRRKRAMVAINKVSKSVCVEKKLERKFELILDICTDACTHAWSACAFAIEAHIYSHMKAIVKVESVVISLASLEYWQSCPLWANFRYQFQILWYSPSLCSFSLSLRCLFLFSLSSFLVDTIYVQACILAMECVNVTFI